MYGGLEGGATNSIFRIFNNNGKIMVETKGEGTNLSLMGVNRVVNIIYQLISKAYLELSRNLNNDCMESLGVALSGAETGNTIVKELEEALENQAKRKERGEYTPHRTYPQPGIY